MKIITEYDEAYVRCKFYRGDFLAFEWIRPRYNTPSHRTPPAWWDTWNVFLDAWLPS